MPFLRTTFRAAIALFGLIAVLLGALEHEDLIFQGHRAAGAEEEAPGVFDGSSAQWQPGPSESGTESKFRRKIDRDWIVSERAPLVMFVGRLTPRPRNLPARITLQRISSRAPATGIVALRL